MIGFRNILVHEYLGVSLEGVWAIVQNELPRLRDVVRRMLSERRRGIRVQASAGCRSIVGDCDVAANRIECVLTNDPAMGVLRHADAGYETAIEVAKQKGVKRPMA